MRTLLVAGGSGGHLIPALTLAEVLRVDGPCSVLSSSRPVERMLATKGSSIDWTTIDLKRLTPLWRWLSPRYMMHQWRAIRQVWKRVRETQPDVVIGFGGYLSAVGVAAARVSGVPTLIHEQNVIPGRANRWLARWADGVAVSFPETRRYLVSKAVVEVTGHPIRPVLSQANFEQGRAFFGFDLNRPVLLMTGGSQGARAINALALAMWQCIALRDRERIQILHLTGLAEVDRVKAVYQQLGLQAQVFSFLHEIQHALAAASLCISRAGATIIAEMTAMGVPAILVPYPYAGGHQGANAHWMESVGGAIVLEERALTPQRLWAEVQTILWTPGRLAQMRAALCSQKNGSATERLVSLVRRVAG